MATTTPGAPTRSAVERLTAMMGSDERFDYSTEEIRELQIAAIDGRFREHRGRVQLLAHLAEEAGITQIRSLDNVVPLLFPHTAYKSYPEDFVLHERWDRLTKWLAAVSPREPGAVDGSRIRDLDGWIDRMADDGIFISCSSGTTGRPAIVPNSQPDLDWIKVDCVTSFTWASGVDPAQDRRLMMLAAVASIAKNNTILEAQTRAFGEPAAPMFRLPMPPITIGSLTRMAVLRRKVTEGRATPEEIAEFERASTEREKLLDRAMAAAAEAIVEHRAEKLFFMGYWGFQFQAAKLVREMGYGAGDFNPDNCSHAAGGLKRAKLPPDYQEFVYETWNIPADRHSQAYGMQELGSTLPRCREGRRHHVPAWLVPLVLDEQGGALLPRVGDAVEGRAAFFDVSLDGRWGGLISGDKISLDYGPCVCGNRSPSIRDDVVRYADLEGEDHIGCEDKVAAYLQGLS
jgi:hypothetical protein